MDYSEFIIQMRKLVNQFESMAQKSSWDLAQAQAKIMQDTAKSLAKYAQDAQKLLKS